MIKIEAKVFGFNKLKSIIEKLEEVMDQSKRPIEVNLEVIETPEVDLKNLAKGVQLDQPMEIKITSDEYDISSDGLSVVFKGDNS